MIMLPLLLMMMMVMMMVQMQTRTRRKFTLFQVLVTASFLVSTTLCHTLHNEPRLVVHIHCVSKNCAKLFLSECRQMSINFDNIWQKDDKEAKIM